MFASKLCESDFQKHLLEIMAYTECYFQRNVTYVKFLDKHIYTYEQTPMLNRDIRIMIAGDNSYFNCKVISGIDTRSATEVDGLNILFDVKSMQIVSVLNGYLLTGIRTAAISGIAAKYLAPQKTRKILIIGAGKMSLWVTQMMGLQFRGATICVFDKAKDKAQQLIKDLSAYATLRNVLAVANSLDEAAKDADLIVTLTPSREPLLRRHQLKNKVHITAIGADTKGKRELATGVLKEAKIVVDDVNQSLLYGELNVPFSKGEISAEQVCGTIFDLVQGKIEGRTETDRITIFDSTGLPIQDLVIHRWVYENVLKSNN